MNDTRIYICPVCGRRFVFGNTYKWKPCCSKDCFYKRIGVLKKKRHRVIHSIEHESFCKNCGKKVDVLHKGAYCSVNCEELFKNIFRLHKAKSRGFCVLCGKSLAFKNIKSRFCGRCTNSHFSKCTCFLKGPGKKDYSEKLTKFLCRISEEGKSYADLQREESLSLMKRGK